jgi:hypothetical protein
MQAEIDARCLTPRLATAKNGGLPKDLHADNFHATMKASRYLEDVTESSSAFAYVSGSKRLTWRRLCWACHRSIQGRSLPDRYSRRGSLFLTEQDRQARGLSASHNFAVLANTLGFHPRSPADKGSTRLAIDADSRINPFNPWPGLDLRWSGQLKNRALQWCRRHQDGQVERYGTQPSWHQVDLDARGNNWTAA